MSVDGRLDWGGSPEMTPFEVLMWRAEADPKLRSTVVMVELLDSVPDWGRFADAHDWASRMVPRFREHVVAPLLGTGTPYWSTDPDFDLHYHLRRSRLPDGAGWHDVFVVAEQAAMTPLDPHRPLWEVTLVEGAPDGRAAYLLKLSHVLSDGMGLTQLLSGLHSRTRGHTPDKPQPSAPRPVSETVSGQLARQVRGDVGALASSARDAAVGLWRALRRPDRAVRDGWEYVASARRVLAPPETAPMPMLAGRSGSWRFRALDVEFAPLRAAGKAAGGSVNDAYMAALLGGFRRYHEQRGEPLPADRAMPVSVPVSVRRPDDHAGGNRFAPGRLAGPVGMVDPAGRVRAVSEGMAATRGEAALESIDLVTPLLARLPGPLISALGGDMTRSNDLQASNIPGLREEVFLAGARIDRVYPYAPLPGCAAMISMVTHGTTCCVGANIDAAAITEPELFERCLAEGFAEVLALAPRDAGAVPDPVRRS